MRAGCRFDELPVNWREGFSSMPIFKKAWRDAGAIDTIAPFFEPERGSLVRALFECLRRDVAICRGSVVATAFQHLDASPAPDLAQQGGRATH